MNFSTVSVIPDISFWQDDNSTPQGVDFVKMRKSVDGVIIRAGQNSWIDQDFARNWQAAKEAGLKRGSYFFYDSRQTPAKQAELWKAAIGNDLPEWGLWIDLEENYNGMWRGEENWKLFADAMRKYFPNTVVGIYTGYGWWSGQSVIRSDYWSTFPLWIAWYEALPEDVILPKPWTSKGAVLWQFTAHGTGEIYGVESKNIDLNAVSKAFLDLFGGETQPPTGGTMDKYMKVTDLVTNGLNIRSSGVNLGTQNDLGDFNLVRGDIIHVVESNTDYYQRFDKLYRDNVPVDLVPSPTGQYWARSTDGVNIWLVDTTFTPPAKTIEKVNIYLAPGSTLTTVYSDGTEKVETA